MKARAKARETERKRKSITMKFDLSVAFVTKFVRTFKWIVFVTLLAFEIQPVAYSMHSSLYVYSPTCPIDNGIHKHQNAISSSYLLLGIKSNPPDTTKFTSQEFQFENVYYKTSGMGMI